MALRIEWEELDMSPRFWESFAGWYDDKAYRHADFAQELEMTARECAANDLQVMFDNYDHSDGGLYDSDYTLGVAEGIQRAITYLREAPKTAELLVWTGGELVPEKEFGEDLDD
ncbi:hypothetical protein HWB05_gp058 [Streptomyces phage BRock]|uniref:Uncharacterized protein n=1 Tax=Streptomyces phage BRock TaxID=1913591 RepID=A0A1J0GVW9_9CAUD|nr:hypothetical protein HWB05_gp058 [Streptomyces phage BRock]APC46320.1 hypothetical protein [Streptomyces phage BRock]